MTLDDSTIVALATPAGLGAISIVRLSGKDAYNIALKLTHKSTLKARYAHLCAIYDLQNDIIDEAIVIYFKAPHSYTTQDLCEIQCHGGLVSAKAIIALCKALGARSANAGEFTKRAFLGGRIDLAQASSIAKIIESKSLVANKMLMRQLNGAIGEFVNSIREQIIELLAFSEVNIDYAEEIEGEYIASMQEKLSALHTQLERVYSASVARAGIFNGYGLSIIGKPNVGKSSLLNALLLEERAIVSDIPGTTRDSIEECIYIGNALVRLIDTAGIRESSDEIEQRGIKKSKEAMEKSDLIIALFDGSKPLDSDDRVILELLKSAKKPILLVINKADLPKAFDSNVLESALDSVLNALCVSVKQNGAEAIITALEAHLSQNAYDDSIILSSAYQIDSLKGALSALDKAKLVLESGTLELFSFHLRECIDSIANITYPYADSQLLDKLFGTFCLGK